jgi:hypothetical protein
MERSDDKCLFYNQDYQWDGMGWLIVQGTDLATAQGMDFISVGVWIGVVIISIPHRWYRVLRIVTGMGG